MNRHTMCPNLISAICIDGLGFNFKMLFDNLRGNGVLIAARRHDMIWLSEIIAEGLGLR